MTVPCGQSECLDLRVFPIVSIQGPGVDSCRGMFSFLSGMMLWL